MYSVNRPGSRRCNGKTTTVANRHRALAGTWELEVAGFSKPPEENSGTYNIFVTTSGNYQARVVLLEQSFDFQIIWTYTGDPLGFVDDRRKSSGNMFKSLEILGNIRAICGANLGNIRGGG